MLEGLFELLNTWAWLIELATLLAMFAAIRYFCIKKAWRNTILIYTYLSLAVISGIRAAALVANQINHLADVEFSIIVAYGFVILALNLYYARISEQKAQQQKQQQLQQEKEREQEKEQAQTARPLPPPTK